MKWHQAVAKYHANWTPEAKAKMMAALAKENDMAEEAGFDCIPCRRRGYGWCYFTRGKTTIHRAVSMNLIMNGWRRSRELGSYTLYSTLEDALLEQNARGSYEDHKFSLAGKK